MNSLVIRLPDISSYQEPDLWATMRVNDSNIYQENGFEMLVDVDGSMFNYKQVYLYLLCYFY